MKKIFFCAFLLFAQNFLLLGQQKVTFNVAKIPASKRGLKGLFLAGDFNSWNPADTAWKLTADGAGAYRILKTLPAGRYNFKVTKGSWESVECRADGKPVENRVVNITKDTTVMLNIEEWQDNFPAPVKVHTASPQVHIISEKFEIPELGKERRIWIYLPMNYKSSKNRYPVIYMHDGQNLFDAFTSGYGEWGVDEFLDKLSPGKECIVVGIDHGGDNRITEYDPYDSKFGQGRGDDYVKFLINTLKPYIDKHYRTKSQAKYTAVAGSSMGGLISMYAALKNPDVFGSAGVFSPAFWIAPAIYKHAQEGSLPPHSRFYFVCGDAESDSMVADMQKMADIVRAKGVTTANSPVVIIKGASHNEKQWNGDFPAFYNWLFK